MDATFPAALHGKVDEIYVFRFREFPKRVLSR